MTFLRTPEMKEYVEELDEAVIGYQYHTNHRDCSAGEDVKRRLYIKRAPDGWMFYCHHCGNKGYLRAADKMYRGMPVVHSTSPFSHVVKMLSAGLGVDDVSLWPVEARIWWYSYDLDDADAKRYNVQWSGAFARLFMKAGGTWVGRGFDKGSRYVRYRETDMPAFFFHEGRIHDITVVEDVVSAYKVHKAGYNVLALLGTKASEQQLDLLYNYKHVNIWLDPDTPGQLGACALYKRINGICDVMNVLTEQPKEVSYFRIKELLGA
jgi:hypothetical protein